MRALTIVGLAVMIALFSVGCSSKRNLQAGQPSGGMYSALDSTAMVYTDSLAQAPIHDHPLRWVGFVGHPLGVVADLTVNRLFYTIASVVPSFFGYTSEDRMIHSQRSKLKR